MLISEILLEKINIQSPLFKQWFQGSKVVDNKRKPLLCYHGTIRDFEGSFKPFTHFGTLKASSDIIKGYDNSVFPRLFPVFLNIKKPYEIYDSTSNNTWKDVGNKLVDDKLITEDEYAAARQLVTFRDRDKINSFFIKILTKNGYDGLIYENKVEDKGSISYVIFRSDQVWPLFQDHPDK